MHRLNVSITGLAATGPLSVCLLSVTLLVVIGLDVDRLVISVVGISIIARCDVTANPSILLYDGKMGGIFWGNFPASENHANEY